ncbi:MFS transporter [Phreatobacter sp. AB_2022a]|uniref:MFS transporter n=1 Tax=Phreatobacter sp. AB_2022a TaxID=3003134 RepID=UPI000571CE59|nr:MFS transporter [Phreatobacter sp. AB_2022a]MCZ0735534.1 MFS transporter [Phreatobacter sp. AB_2022a]CEJ13885.1 Putative niacin/nicotinamide transporter NaiP [bacterium YEK0313]
MTTQSTTDTAAMGDTSLTAFYRDMNPLERRTFWACFFGWVLDALDFMIYPLVIGTLIAMWQIDRGIAGAAVTVTLLASAFGGWIAGYLSDRLGRVRTLQITIVWFCFFTLLCAFAQNYTQLMIFRALLGLGFGGEWAAGAVLIGETIRAQYRGRAVGSVQSGWALGWGAAVLLQAICFSLLPAEEAWRWMFALGAIPGLAVLFLRRLVPEPEVAVEARAQAVDKPPIWAIFRGDLLKTTILASILCTGAQGGYYAITTWLPTFLRAERGLTVVGSTGYLAMIIIGSFVGYLVGAWLADRLGRRLLFIIFAVGAAAVVLPYTVLPISNEIMWLLGFPLGFFASGYFSGMGAFLTELYPTILRGSGQGFCYNFGRGIGALFPTLVGFLAERLSLAAAIAAFGLTAYALLVIAALLLPETRGKELTAD